MWACFQMEGRLDDLTERLKRVVRYAMARLPKCFKWIIDMPSGPTAEDDLARFIAFMVSSSEKGENS